jgi:hypothetical protein
MPESICGADGGWSAGGRDGVAHADAANGVPFFRGVSSSFP